MLMSLVFNLYVTQPTLEIDNASNLVNLNSDVYRITHISN